MENIIYSYRPHSASIALQMCTFATRVNADYDVTHYFLKF